jgi:hypothetical protein
VASVAALTELAALWPGDVVVVDDILAPPSLRTIIDELDFAYWWPRSAGGKQREHERSLVRRRASQPLTACSGGRTDIYPPAVGIFGNPNRNRSPNARTRTSRTRTVTSSTPALQRSCPIPARIQENMRVDGSRAALAEQHNGDDEPPHDNEHICRFSGTQRTNRRDTHTTAAITPWG